MGGYGRIGVYRVKIVFKFSYIFQMFLLDVLNTAFTRSMDKNIYLSPLIMTLNVFISIYKKPIKLEIS